MFIKLTKVYDGKIANKYAAKCIEGTKLDDGSPWEKSFFANQKDLVQKLTDFSVGDEVNVVMQHVKDKIYNIIDFKEVTDEDKEKLKGAKRSGSGGGSNFSARRPDGGSRGDDTNRSAAIYLARDLVVAVKDPKVLYKMSTPDLLDEVLATAEVVNEYIKDGLLPPPADGIVPDRDEALEPPEIE